MRILASILSTTMISLAPALVLAQEAQVKCIGCMPIPSIEQLAIETTPTTPPAPATPAPVERKAIAVDQTGKMTGDVLYYFGLHRACRDFATPEGGYGTYGKRILSLMTPEKYPALFQGTKDIVALCPKYPSFGEAERVAFYTNLFAHLAYVESSCDYTKGAPGPNGRAHGLLALFRFKEYTSTAPDSYRNKCVKGDSETPGKSLRCGLAIMEGQFTNREKLFTKESYWEPFVPKTSIAVEIFRLDPRRPGKRLKKEYIGGPKFIKEAIRRFPLCK